MAERGRCQVCNDGNIEQLLMPLPRQRGERIAEDGRCTMSWYCSRLSWDQRHVPVGIETAIILTKAAAAALAVTTFMESSQAISDAVVACPF